MNKRITALSSAVKNWVKLVFLIIAIGLNTGVNAEESAKFRVGAIIPFTGELAFFGTALRQGLELADSEDATDTIKIKFEDDQTGDRKATANALQHLISFEKIDIAILTAMPSVVIADSIVNKGEVIALSAWDSNDAVKSLSKNIFGFGWSNERTGELAAQTAQLTLKAKTAAIVSAHDEWSEIMSHAFSQKFKSNGGEIVYSANVNLDDTDFRSIVLKIKKSNADVVYFPLYRASLLAFARQLKESGYPGTLITAEGMSETEIAQLKDLAEGMYVTQAYLADSQFDSKYRKFFKLEKTELNLAHVALGYDLYNFLLKSATVYSAGKSSPSPRLLRDVIESTQLEGVLGKSAFKDRSTDRAQVMLIVRGGKLQRIGTN